MTSSVLGNDIQTGQRVELHKSSRRQGTYFIAATGVGKSTSLRYLIEQDIKQQIGVCVLDPHGDLIDDLIGSLHDKKDRDKVILLDAQDESRVFGINLYQCDNPTSMIEVQKVVSRVMHIFTLLFGDDDSSLGVRITEGLENSAYALAENPGMTMAEIPLLFGDDNTARLKLTPRLKNAEVRRYWEHYSSRDSKYRDERSDPVQNKIGFFLRNPLVQNIIGQGFSTINFRDVIDSTDGKIVLVRMYGESERVTQLIGSMVLAQLLLAAYSRHDTEKEKRRQFHIYCDEFELYATDDFTRLLKECRKYGMGMTIAHQSREDISLRNKAASLQVANIITGRLIPDDAKDIAPIFKADPKPGETEYKQIYHRHVEQRLVKKFDPPENEEKLKKKEAIARQVQEFRDRLNRFIQDTNFLYLFTSEFDYLRTWAETRQPEEELRRVFYEHFNPRFIFTYKAVGAFTGLKEVFPSEAVKNALRPKPVPGERFFIVVDPTLHHSWNLVKSRDADDASKALVVSGSGFPRITDFPLSGDETDRQLLRVLTSITQQIQRFDRRTQVLSVQNSIQSLLRPYRENAIYHFVPGIPNKRKLREEAGARVAKADRLAHRGSPYGIVDETRDPQYKELLRREEAIYSLLDDRRNYTLHHTTIWESECWRIQQYPRLWDWFKEEWRKHNELVAHADALLKLHVKLEEEIRALRLTGKDVLEPFPVTYKAPTGEEYPEVYVRAEEERMKISQGFSETYDVRYGSPGYLTSRGKSINVSSERIPLYEQKPGDDEQIANAWNRSVDELTHLPVGVARCRVQNAAGEIEEHIIKLAMSTTGIAEKHKVEQWIEEIKQRMLKVDKTLRSIKDVEQEIAERHALLRQSPAQPILPEMPDRPQRKKPING